MNILRRFTPRTDVSLQQRAEGDKPPVIAGYGSVFYDGTPNTEYRLWEDYIERILPGAFDDVVKRDDVVCLFNHSDNLILGRSSAGTLRLTLDGKGLRYECDAPNTSYSRDLQESLGRGDVKGSSFSFLVAEDRTTKLEDGTWIVEILKIKRLFDVGPVTIPAYTGTEAELRALKQRAESRLPEPTNTPEHTRRALNEILAGDLA